MPAISISNLSKLYRAGRGKPVQALNDVSFAVERGEIFGLLGPNGAGKTTLIKCLLDIVRPTGGDATVLGAAAGDVVTKKRIGYLPENHRYPNYLTGGQVLEYFGTLGGMTGDELRERVDQVLTLVNMREWASTRIRKYSKGMLQRIGLAQALLQEPEVVFLDEPTDGVDPLGRKEIREMLAHLKQRGTTVFLNSHLLSEVELICDRVAILNKGSLVRIGAVADLTTTKHEYVIGVAGDLQAAAQAVSTVATVVAQGEGSLTVHVDDAATLNRIIDTLRAAGVAISDISQRKETLESAFLELIEKV